MSKQQESRQDILQDALLVGYIVAIRKGGGRITDEGVQAIRLIVWLLCVHSDDPAAKRVLDLFRNL